MTNPRDPVKVPVGKCSDPDCCVDSCPDKCRHHPCGRKLYVLDEANYQARIEAAIQPFRAERDALIERNRALVEALRAVLTIGRKLGPDYFSVEHDLIRQRAEAALAAGAEEHRE